MTEERNDIVVMVDEDGNEEEFSFLDSIEVDGGEYVVLMPYDEEEAEYESEVVILKVVHEEGGQDSFVNIEDEEELNAVFNIFKDRMDAEYDFN